MVWESLPVIYADGSLDRPAEAVWPFLPPWSEGRLPMNKQGRLISTANARLRTARRSRRRSWAPVSYTHLTLPTTPD